MNASGLPADKSREKIGWRIALLVMATLAVFAPVMWHGGFFWDDYDLIVNNPLIKAADGVRDFWLTTKNFDYFPLTSTTFWIEWRLWGAWPQPYHVLNVLLHAGSAILLWRILKLLQVPGAFWAALVFAVHPVNVESVAWISERKNTLSMFLMCVAVLSYLRFERTRSAAVYAGALGAFVLALLAKTAVVMLPFILLLLAWYQRGKVTKREVLATGPFFLASLLLGIITIYFQYHRSISDIVVRTDSMASRIATAGCAVWFYLFKAIVPIDMMFNYPRWDVAAYGAAGFLPAALLGVGLGALGILRHPGARKVLVALASYILLLLPMLGLLNVFYMRYALVSDHYEYHGVACVIALVIAGITVLHRRASVSMKGVIRFLSVVIVIMLAAESASIAAVYRSAESVWLDTLAHNPRSWLAHAQLGEMYLKDAAGDRAVMEKAIVHLRAVTDLRPELAIGYANLGAAHVVAGDREAARDAFASGLAAPVSTRLERARIHQGLGSLAATAGNYSEAEKEFRQAVAEDPESASIHYALGETYALQGKTAMAREELERARAIDPENAGIRAMLQKLAAPATAP